MVVTMSNYKWLTHCKPGETIEAWRTVLCSDDFQGLSFPSVAPSKINTFIEEELLKAGIETEIECDFDSYYFNLKPVNPKYISMTAPLYVCDDDGGYQKIDDSYTAKAIDPAQYEWVRQEFKRCKETVYQQQVQRFSKIFQENSLDGGLTAVIDIAECDVDIPEGAFYEGYIPNDDFFRICCLNDRFDPERPSICIFMKKMDAKRGVVTIKIPDGLKGLTIGKNGANIKMVANMINARRINVN